jgi:hypothetical protein
MATNHQPDDGPLMRALLQQSAAGPKDLTLRELRRPTAGPDQDLIPPA